MGVDLRGIWVVRDVGKRIHRDRRRGGWVCGRERRDLEIDGRESDR